MKEIKICMGSACFARGNAKNLELIQQYIKEHGLDVKVMVYGVRCSDKCAAGPYIIIDGKEYSEMVPEKIAGFLEEKLNG